ncbi:Formin-like protein 1 [Paramecium bursaria]
MTDLKEAFLQKDRLIQIQQEMLRRKDSIDKLRNKAIKQLRDDNLQLSNQVRSLKAQIAFLEAEVFNLKQNLLNKVDKEMPKYTPPQIVIPLPPPPPLPQKMKQAEDNRRRPKKKLRKINWEQIPQNKIEDTFWKDVDDSQVQLDWEWLEEQFSAQAAVQQSEKAKEQQSKAISAERQRTIELFLAKYKLTYEILLQKLEVLDINFFNIDLVEGLIKCLPLEKEAQLIKEQVYQQLNQPEKFIYNLIKIPFYQQRVKSLQFQEQYLFIKSLISKHLKFIEESCLFTLNNQLLKDASLILLAVGNYLNWTDSTKSDVKGVKMDAFEKTTMMKTNDKKGTLLGYIVKVMSKKIDIQLLKYDFVDEASKFSLLQIMNDFNQLKQLFQDLKIVVESQEQYALAVFSKQYDEASVYMEQQQQEILKVQKLYQDTCKMYGESYLGYDSDKFFAKIKFIMENIKEAHKNLLHKAEEEKKKQLETETKQQLVAIRQSILVQDVHQQMKLQQVIQKNLQNKSLKELIQMQKNLKKK